MGMSEEDLADPTEVTKTSKYQTSVSTGGSTQPPSSYNRPAPASRATKSAYDDDDDSRPLGSQIRSAPKTSYVAPANTERYSSYVTSEGRDGRGEVDKDYMLGLRERQQRREDAEKAAGDASRSPPDAPTRRAPNPPREVEDDTEPMFKKSAAADRAALINSCLSNDRLFMSGAPPPTSARGKAPSDEAGSAYGGDRSAFLRSMGIDNAGSASSAVPKRTPVARPTHNLGHDDDDDLSPSRNAPPSVRDADEIALQTALSHQELIRQRRAKAKAEAAKKRGEEVGDDAGGLTATPVASARSGGSAGSDAAPKIFRNVYNEGAAVPTTFTDRASQEYAKARPAATGEPEEPYRSVRSLNAKNFASPNQASSPDSPQGFQPPPATSDLALGSRKGNVYSQGTFGTAAAAPPSQQSGFTSSARSGLNASPYNSASSYKREDSSTNNNFNSTTGSLGGTIRSEEDGLSGEELKDMGNRYFEGGDFRKAVRMYSKAIEKDPSNAAIYSNRSAAYLQASKQMGIDTRTMALRDADKVIELRPTWFKGYSRQGDAYFKLENFKEAIQSYERGLAYDADNVNLIHSLGEARNAAGNRVVKSNDNPWNTVENTTRAPKREFGEGKSARELAMEHKEALYSTVGLGGTGKEYLSQELNKFRTHKSYGSDSLDSTVNSNIGSPPPPPERSSNRAPQQQTQPAPRGPPSTNVDIDPSAFDSNAAAAYQQRLLEEYRRKKAMAGR